MALPAVAAAVGYASRASSATLAFMIVSALIARIAGDAASHPAAGSVPEGVPGTADDLADADDPLHGVVTADVGHAGKAVDRSRPEQLGDAEAVAEEPELRGGATVVSCPRVREKT